MSSSDPLFLVVVLVLFWRICFVFVVVVFRFSFWLKMNGNRSQFLIDIGQNVGSWWCMFGGQLEFFFFFHSFFLSEYLGGGISTHVLSALKGLLKEHGPTIIVSCSQSLIYFRFDYVKIFPKFLRLARSTGKEFLSSTHQWDLSLCLSALPLVSVLRLFLIKWNTANWWCIYPWVNFPLWMPEESLLFIPWVIVSFEYILRRSEKSVFVDGYLQKSKISLLLYSFDVPIVYKYWLMLYYK